jgi:hypothetical protein
MKTYQNQINGALRQLPDDQFLGGEYKLIKYSLDPEQERSTFNNQKQTSNRKDTTK